MQEETQLINDFLTNHRRIRYVERLAGSYKIQPYNNAVHQYFTGIFFIHFAKEEKIEISLEIVEKVLCHDIMELYTGDLLSPAKNLNSKTKQLWTSLESEVEQAVPMLMSYADSAFHKLMTIEQWKLFKTCDLLELWCFCIEEAHLGNTSNQNTKIIERCTKDLEVVTKEFKSIESFMTHFQNSI